MRGDQDVNFVADDELYRRFRSGNASATRTQTLPPMSGPITMEDGTVVTPHDPVQQPSHYQQFGVEVIDIIRHVLGPEGFRAYCIGNELKYRLRAGDKGDAAQDLAKAMKYREFREGK